MHPTGDCRISKIPCKLLRASLSALDLGGTGISVELWIENHWVLIAAAECYSALYAFGFLTCVLEASVFLFVLSSAFSGVVRSRTWQCVDAPG